MSAAYFCRLHAFCVSLWDQKQVDFYGGINTTELGSRMNKWCYDLTKLVDKYYRV